MSEKKGEVEGESKKAEDRKEVADDKKSKTKKETTPKKAKLNNVTEENNDDSKETDSSENETAKATKSKKTSKKSKENQEEEEYDDDIKVEKKIPLLDQPPIIEGSRVRTCVIKAEAKAVVEARGKGKPLGKMTIVNQRLKRLRMPTLKTLHRLLFGRVGKVSLVLSDIQQFRGFPFLEDSDDYSKKVTELNKLHMDQLKELIFSFDLDMKLKKKEECTKEIVNFLISPKTYDKPQNPMLSHPKRKATKRNYFDADGEVEEVKKRKKTKPTVESKKEKTSENDESPKVSAKSSKTNEKSPKNDTVAKNDEDHDSSSELKKPAKKRKRNQIIDEEEKSENKKDTEAEDDDDDEEGSDSQSSAQKSSSDKDKLSDEELKVFLKKVLADLNLENTTMKTVYNLISSEYPTYDYSKKKRFIKGVVKSLIQ